MKMRKKKRNGSEFLVNLWDFPVFGPFSLVSRSGSINRFAKAKFESLNRPGLKVDLFLLLFFFYAGTRWSHVKEKVIIMSERI
jgi:hypothetical protein